MSCILSTHTLTKIKKQKAKKEMGASTLHPSTSSITFFPYSPETIKVQSKDVGWF